MSLQLNSPLPDFSGATNWINGQPERASLFGHPLLVHFWSVSCYLCHENMPKLTLWRERYGPQGLKLIAVHLPRQEEDTGVEWVRQMVEALWITEPCGIDNRHLVRKAFDNLYVPAYFLFDSAGLLQARTGGCTGLVQLEQALQRQFGLREGAVVTQPQPAFPLAGSL